MESSKILKELSVTDEQYLYIFLFTGLTTLLDIPLNNFILAGHGHCQPILAATNHFFLQKLAL